jgi:hypothetical protein
MFAAVSMSTLLLFLVSNVCGSQHVDFASVFGEQCLRQSACRLCFCSRRAMFAAVSMSTLLLFSVSNVCGSQHVDFASMQTETNK